MSLRIAIRTDASVEIGVGHAVRCLTLASALRELGAQVTFALGGSHSAGHTLVANAGFPIQNVEKTHAPLKGQWDWAVIDHYDLDRRWEERARLFAQRVFVIDDLANRPHACDVLLDQNLFEAMGERYAKLVHPSCEQLYGPKFALIRPEFQTARAHLKKRAGKRVDRVLVSYGGTDPYNATVRVLDALARLPSCPFAIDVVIGSSNPHREEVAAKCALLKTAHLIVQSEKMAALMADSDLALGAAGSSTWERACLGLPTLTLSLTPSQEEIAQAVVSVGAAAHMGKFQELSSGDIARAIERAVSDGPLRAQMEERALALVDGEGATRVAKRLMALAASAP